MKSHKEEDKRYLTSLAEALNTSERCMKTDECGDWNIFGKRGKISTDGEWWYLYTEATSKRHWTAIKKKLHFMDINIDGDDEGILKLKRMPSPEEAEVVREIIGLNKRPALTDEYREILSTRIINLRNKGVSSSLVSLNEKDEVR